MTSKNELIRAINSVSYYNAAEGAEYFNETIERNEAIKTLQALVRDADRQTIIEALKTSSAGLYGAHELGISYPEYEALRREIYGVPTDV